VGGEVEKPVQRHQRDVVVRGALRSPESGGSTTRGAWERLPAAPRPDLPLRTRPRDEATTRVAGDHELEPLCAGHLKETEGHPRLIEEWLDAHDGSRSSGKNLETASHELLRRPGERATDDGSVQTTATILVAERRAAERLAASYDLAPERSLSGAAEA
jgi:hypothetical protein